MKLFKCVFIFVVIQIIIAFIAWLGGFNFDHRDWEVAYWAVIGMILGCFAIVIFITN